MSIRSDTFIPLAQLAAHLGRQLRIALLERRSKHDEDTKSLQVQHDALLRFLATLPAGSYVCDMRLAEDGGDVYRQVVSAWKGDGKHKLLRRVLADLSEYDVVLVHRMDRFGRNVVAVLTALDDMAQAGVRLYSVEQGLDTADPKQQFNTGLYALLAQQSSDLTSTRIRENKTRAKELGGWRGGAITFGYRKAMTTGPDGEPVPVRDAAGYKTLELDPAEAPHLLAVIDKVVDHGWSVAAAVRWLNEQGVRSPRGTRTTVDGSREPIAWSVTGLKRVLTNPMLMGYDVVGVGKHRFQILEVDGHLHRPHPPLITDPRWHKLQIALGSRTVPRRPATESLLAGLVTCGAHRGDNTVCGRRMHGPGTITSDSASYACRTSNTLPLGDPRRCTGNSISARGLHRLVETTVLAIAADPRWQEGLRTAYRQARAEAATAQATDLGAELAELQRRMTDLREERNSAKSNSRRTQVTHDIDALDARIAELEQLGQTPDLADDVEIDFHARWQTMDQSERRAVIADLIERIDVDTSGGRGRAFDPTRVRVHIRHVGVLQLTEPLPPAPALVCPECGACFERPAGLGVHRRHRHGVLGAQAKAAGAATVYACPQPGCERRTTSAGGLKRHITAAHPDTQQPLACPHGCPKTFATELDLSSHLRQVHGSARDATPASCPECDRVFRGEHGLQVHQGRMHPHAG